MSSWFSRKWEKWLEGCLKTAGFLLSWCEGANYDGEARRFCFELPLNGVLMQSVG